MAGVETTGGAATAGDGTLGAITGELGRAIPGAQPMRTRDPLSASAMWTMHETLSVDAEIEFPIPSKLVLNRTPAFSICCSRRSVASAKASES